jgi:hypothetical protein
MTNAHGLIADLQLALVTRGHHRAAHPHSVIHAGVDGEDIDQAGQGQDAPHRPAQRGEQQVTAGLPGLRPHPAQRTQGAAVDELQRGQVDDDPRAASAASASATLAAWPTSSSPSSATTT